MITREELLKTPEYWFENFQNDLYGEVVAYMEKEGINQSQLAERLGVTKGYISQILRGEFNYTVKKLIELSLAIDKVPQMRLRAIDEVLKADAKKGKREETQFKRKREMQTLRVSKRSRQA